MLEPFLVAAATVFLAEFGDKSQLLAMVLAAKFRRPGAVIAGMALGLLLNHVLAAAVGTLVSALLPADVLRWIVGGGFLAAAAWVIWPRAAKEDEAEAPVGGRRGPFVATAITFFLVEMGDKTQLMTVALTARFDAPVPVVLGATTGMLMATVPAVIFADRLLTRLPLRLLRMASALVFAGVGVATLLA